MKGGEFLIGWALVFLFWKELGGGWRPKAELSQLFFGLFCPALVGEGVGGAGMEDLADADRRVGKNELGSLFGEGADADDPFWLQDVDDFAQVGVAGGFEFSSGGGCG